MGGRKSNLRLDVKLPFIKNNHIQRNCSFPSWLIPVVLLVLCLLSYGILANKLGYYWDDWTIAYYIHFFKPSIFKTAFLQDRPLLGWFYFLTTGFVGESPFSWQIFGIFTRWICAISFWWMLKGLWPHKVFEITAITLLFTVYPGFSQQYIAISYSHHLLLLTMTLASLGALNWALRSFRWFWPIFFLSVVFSGIAMFTMEYFFGL